jgi:hypothetical protein
MVAAVFRERLAGKLGLFAGFSTISCERYQPKPVRMPFSNEALILRARLLSIGIGDYPEEKSNIRNSREWQGRKGWTRMRG